MPRSVNRLSAEKLKEFARAGAEDYRTFFSAGYLAGLRAFRDTTSMLAARALSAPARSDTTTPAEFHTNSPESGCRSVSLQARSGDEVTQKDEQSLQSVHHHNVSDVHTEYSLDSCQGSP